ncbi:hypothetical protein ABZS66_00115 [Dactylosporangium sp. NPDC005572]|uniref:hypothetical protein n=1 Tax=Dactylosporangium sp. NPDC005572 TaxID=3156889 RepID=UPI0033BC0476
MTSTPHHGDALAAQRGRAPSGTSAMPPVVGRRRRLPPATGIAVADRDDPDMDGIVVVPREFGAGRVVDQLWQRAARLPIGTSLIGLTSADGGVGRSTLTAALGGLLALAAMHPVLAVDATARPWSGLTDRVRGDGGTLWDALQAVKTGARVYGFGAARSWTRRGATGVYALTAEPQRTPQRRPPTFTEAVQVISALGPHTSAVVAELPVADVSGVWRYLTVVTAPVLVARASVDGVRHALHLLAQLRAGGLDAVADRAVLAVVASAPQPPREVRAVCHQAASRVRSVVRVPFDEHLARPEPVDVRRCRRATRVALVALAAACMPDSMVPSQPAPTRQSDAGLRHAGGSPTS